METGLFEIQADHLRGYRQARQLLSNSCDVIDAVRRPNTNSRDGAVGQNPMVRPLVRSAMKSDGPTAALAQCFLRLANLPNFALDRLSRYEATLWRQVARILLALDALDRRKPQERARGSHSGDCPDSTSNALSGCRHLRVGTVHGAAPESDDKSW
jgi:hypothetical protein